MMKKKAFAIAVCALLVLGIVTAMTVNAGGPPLKEQPCGICHKDYKAIFPKNHPDVGAASSQPCLGCHAPDPSRAEATKFSTMIHKSHKEGGKTTLECGACHAL